MSAYEVLASLVRVPAVGRLAALSELLPGATRQEFTGPKGRPGTNLLIGDPSPRLILGAHHDIDPGTIQGAMDNTASVATLVDLVHHYGQLPPGLQICFWDMEEPGNGGFSDGAEAYARALRRDAVIPEMAIVCDVLGVGIPWISRRSDSFNSFLVRRVFQRENVPSGMLTTPGSDDAGLRRGGIPSALLCTLPADRSMRTWSAMHTSSDRIELISRDSLDLTTHGLKSVVAEYVADMDIQGLLEAPGYREQVLADTLYREEESRRYRMEGSFSTMTGARKMSGTKASARKSGAGTKPKPRGKSRKQKALENDSFARAIRESTRRSSLQDAGQYSFGDDATEGRWPKGLMRVKDIPEHMATRPMAPPAVQPNTSPPVVEPDAPDRPTEGQIPPRPAHR